MNSWPKLFLFCILVKSYASSQAIWEAPYFSSASSSISVSVIDSVTAIEFDEEITPPFIIANINYSGTNTPVISDIQGDGTNSTLGIIAKQSSSNQWQLVVTIRQDYESKLISYMFTVSIDQVSTSVSIAIDDIHDNAPTIQPDSKSCHVNESFTGQTSCTFVIQDVDGDVKNLSVIVDAGEANKDLFSMDTTQVDSSYHMTMALNVLKPLDYETQDLYSITIIIQCSLGAKPLESSVSIIVQVDDLPDEPPKWTVLPIVITVKEKTKTSASVKAIDGDLGINAVISYSIIKVTENLSSYVQIDSNGLITIQKIDRDVTGISSFIITVKAFEANDTSSYISADITVMVEDLDDHSPDVQPSFLSITIPERRPTTFDSQITIKDPDWGESGSFNVQLASTSDIAWNEAFEVIPSYGYQSLRVTVATTNYSLLDYSNENWRNITLQLIATEVANINHTGIAILNISLKPVNDRYPQFIKQSYEFSVLETIGKGEVVLTVSATDDDFGDTIRYKMDSTVLAVNSLSGVITIAEDGAFDYEKQKVVQEVVQAVDYVGHTTYAQITVNVIDVDDTPPTLTLPSEVLKVKENSIEGTVITSSDIITTDPDTNASVTFSFDWTKASASKQGVALTNNSLLEGCLEIKSIKVSTGRWKGEISVKKNILDYEKFDSLYVTIVVRDDNTQLNDAERTAIATIEIEDVNDNKPLFDTIPELSVEENSKDGKVIGSVTAKDADGPLYNSITYSLQNTASTPADLVRVDSKTGELKVQKDGGIDCEMIQTLFYIITASDGELSSDATITITVIDQNDEIPKVSSPSSTNFEVTIKEESPSGTLIFNIVGNDLDFSDPFHNITYLINYEDYPNLEDYFYIEPYTGELLVRLKSASKTLDRDNGVERYIVHLILRDNYQHHSLINSNHIEQMLTVILSDINDNKPVFPEVSGYLFSVKENVKNGTSLLATPLQATDKDEGDNAKVTYSIVNITAGPDVRNIPQADLFRIETVRNAFAELYANVNLEGFFGTYTIYLKAEDHGSPSQIGEKSYQVYIEDINDNAPEFVYPEKDSVVYIQEIQLVGSNVLDRNGKALPSIYATDQDTGDNAKITYYLHGSDIALQYFVLSNINDSTSLQSRQSMDKENIQSIQLMLEARDQGTPPLSKMMNTTLLVITTVEQEPHFTQSTWTVHFTENSSGLQQSQLIPTAIDKNNVNKNTSEYQMIYYFIVGSANAELFQLDSTSHTLRLLKELDREQSAQLYISVVTTNSKTGPPESPDASSLINITVNVEDINDCAPTFLHRLYAGGIKPTDDVGKLVLTVEATDPDLNDSVSYSLAGSITASDPTLSSQTSSGINFTDSGQILLNFKPQIDMKGYLYFNVTATDLVGHTDSAHVQVYLISAANMVTFTFQNTLEVVNAQKNKIEEIFTAVFGYQGTIDSVTKSLDDNQQAIPNATDIQVHFIDTTKDLPVDAQVILQQVANIGMIKKLKADLFSETSLELEDLQAQTSNIEQSSDGNIPWVLFTIVVVIMAAMIVSLLGLYIWRTKSLQERLDRMAATSNIETHRESNTNVTLSTTNLYENRTNPVLGLTRPVINTSEDIDAYIDEALHGLEDKIDLSSVPAAAS